ncbi:uncharacterized protein LOC115511793 isoform X2 [Lynx canadensis]|uniref:uncharacterized protein LOC115511793 isoform X2 n=1 Tax=Lynx canadensis TaxID=61383 RepID=UPI0011B036D8|nr:uncharacterized protein LOC115511793 isoform X2 [Lynx canadensis]
MLQREITLPSGRCYLFHIQETASSCKTSTAVKLTSLSARSLRTTGTHPVFLGCLVFRVFKQVVSTQVMGSYLMIFADCFFERGKHDMNETNTLHRILIVTKVAYRAASPSDCFLCWWCSLYCMEHRENRPKSRDGIAVGGRTDLSCQNSLLEPGDELEVGRRSGIPAKDYLQETALPGNLVFSSCSLVFYLRQSYTWSDSSGLNSVQNSQWHTGY